jgi:hypothetical protein
MTPRNWVKGLSLPLLRSVSAAAAENPNKVPPPSLRDESFPLVAGAFVVAAASVFVRGKKGDLEARIFRSQTENEEEEYEKEEEEEEEEERES